jgi:hypothetical protein
MNDLGASGGDPVKRRRVFYVSGFDPKGPAWYYELFAAEAPKQATVGGYELKVGERGRAGKFVARWTLDCSKDGQRTETVYDFLRWDDIMRAHWPRGEFNMIWVFLRTYWRYIETGVLYRVLKVSWPTFITACYPAVLILALVFVAILLPILGASLLSPWWLWAVAALPLSWLVIRFGMPFIDRVFGALWLVRIYAFNLQQARRTVAGIDERLDLLSRHISEVTKDGPDETLIIGHSTGVQLAVSILARTLTRDPELARRTKLSFLTLGGSIPMLGWQPEADWFCKEIAALSQQPELDWLDFTTAQDGATFAMLDPVQLLELPQAANGPRPKVLSTKLFEMFKPETFARVRRDWRLVHFQYLMAFEMPGDYDYFTMTAGPQTLAQRFAHRHPAKPLAKFKLRMFRK